MIGRERIVHDESGRKIGFAEYGDLDGKPLFFLHGWPNSRLHGEILDTVAKKLQLRIISPDRPGYGISEYQNNRTLLDYPRDVEHIANNLEIKKFSIIGNSGGGPYAAATAYTLPHRIVKVGIVVGLGPTYIPGALDGLPFFNKLGWSNYKRFPFLTIVAAWLLNVKANFLSSWVFFDYSSDSDKQILKNVSLPALKRRRKEAFRNGIKGAAHDLKLYSNHWGFSLKKITVPTYLWYGGKDQKVSLNQGRYYEKEIPQSVFTLYSDEGHMILHSHMEEILKTFT